MANEVRMIPGELVAEAVSALYTSVCTIPDPQVEKLLSRAMEGEPPGPGREALGIELENFRIAGETGLPICQDTGTAVILIELGNLVCVEDGGLGEFVNEGVRRACSSAFLRPSQVFPPLSLRENTMDNSPAVLFIDHIKGNCLRISLMAKGAGCENVSRSAMLPPLSGEAGVTALAESCLSEGASRACPPVFIGIGIGGTLEASGILAKKALFREPGTINPDPDLAAVEDRMKKRLNTLGTGPQGFGGETTVLEVRILHQPCHMASLPVSVCIECHAHRTASCEI
jgi:fumarate hydratase subunit alpha